MTRCALLLVGLATPAVAAAADGPGPGSLLPPLVAICLAVLTRRVLPSLAVGVLLGVFVIVGLAPTDAAALGLRIARDVVVDVDHLTIVAFSVAVAATVGVMDRSGGTRALIGRLEGLARGPRGAMVASWIGGAAVFFDDYASCLVVGGSMGPLYDRHRVSRAKLAYIVDSTAAPVASMALVSTWIGYEIGLLDEALASTAGATTGFALFVDSLPYRFYSLFTLAFVGAVAFTGRDFGPMWRVERDARSAPPPSGVRGSAPARGASLAIVPITALVGVTLTLLVRDGRASAGPDAPFFEILGAADPFDAMLRGSLVALVLGSGLAWGAGALTVRALPGAAWSGVRPVLDALLVLALAWALADVVALAGTGEFLAGLLGGWMPAWLLPTATFLLAGATAFATGTSFGAMGILVPIVVPLSLALAPDQAHVLLGCAGAILAGACLGDHASPISDTTVLASVGAGTDVLTHVRTQMPYAATTGALSVVFGTLPTGFGVSPWLVIPVGLLASVLVVRLFGRAVDAPVPAADAATARPTTG